MKNRIKMPLIRGGKCQVTVYLTQETLEKLDRRCGNKSRASYIEELIEIDVTHVN